MYMIHFYLFMYFFERFSLLSGGFLSRKPRDTGSLEPSPVRCQKVPEKSNSSCDLFLPLENELN